MTFADGSPARRCCTMTGSAEVHEISVEPPLERRILIHVRYRVYIMWIGPRRSLSAFRSKQALEVGPTIWKSPQAIDFSFGLLQYLSDSESLVETLKLQTRRGKRSCWNSANPVSAHLLFFAWTFHGRWDNQLQANFPSPILPSIIKQTRES